MYDIIIDLMPIAVSIAAVGAFYYSIGALCLLYTKLLNK